MENVVILYLTTFNIRILRAILIVNIEINFSQINHCIKAFFRVFKHGKLF
jgi:hypothetical protein